jgi:hypothetical protein
MLKEFENNKVVFGLGIVFLAVILLAMAYGAIKNPNTDSRAGSVEVNRITAYASSSAVTLGTSSTYVTATSTSRVYLKITNVGSNYVCLNFNDKAAVDCEGVYLGQGDSFVSSGENLYTGAIRGIANTGATAITFIEK